jgi:hypothetical protein
LFLKKILIRFSKSYELDLRALSLMRIGTALVIIFDLLIRAGDLSAHYTDAGLWPTHLIHTFGWKTGFWSLHEQSGTYAWILFLFILHLTFALSLLFGYKTKLSTLLVWLLYISLHNRNLYIQQSGDDLLRLLLFWGLFLPWNAYYSLDSRHFYYESKQKHLANIGYLLLVSSVYFFTVNLKDSPEWRSEGTAIYYALSLDQLRLQPAGDWLYGYPGLMKALTHVVYYMEFLIPVLIIWPAKKGYLRFVAFLFILFLHAGIGLTLYVGLFFVINIVTAIGLIPEAMMDKLEDKARWLRFISREAILSSSSKRPKKKKNLRAVTNAICIAVIVISLIGNLASVRWFSYELRKELMIPVNAARLDQYWGMFSPSVLKRDGWFVYHGLDSIGRQWDLRLNQDYVDYKKPASVVRMYKTDRWRKLAENMQRESFTFLRPLYCRYIIKKWNKDHPEKQLVTLNLKYMQKESLPGYRTTPVTEVLFSVCDGR